MRIDRLFTCILAVLLLGLSVDGSASAMDNTASIGDLETLQAQTIVLKAKLARAKVESDLKATNVSGHGVADEDASINEPPPVVSEVYGAPGDLKATFLYADGSSVPGYAGKHIAGDCFVLSVALDSVRVRCHGHTTNVGFSGAAPQPTRAAFGTQKTPPAFFPNSSFSMPAPSAPGATDAH